LEHESGKLQVGRSFALSHSHLFIGAIAFSLFCIAGLLACLVQAKVSEQT
jgi:hypothetical protein